MYLFLQKLWVFLRAIFQSSPEKLVILEEQPLVNELTNMTNEEKLIKVCVDALDTDVTPQDKIPDQVACSEVMSTLIQKVFSDFPTLPSTRDLFNKLKSDKRFRATLTPRRGVIVVSPRTPTQTGHVGFFITDERIASNNSKTGLWQGNYFWPSWIKEFIKEKGLHSYLFEIIS